MPHFIDGEKAIDTVRGVRKEVQKNMFTYLAAGFGFVAGLAWNDAVKALIDYLLPNTKNTILAKFGYAVLLTLLVSIALFYMERALRRDEDA